VLKSRRRLRPPNEKLSANPIQRRPRRPFDWSTAVVATLVTAAAVTVYTRGGRARFLEIFFGDLDLFAMMLPKVLAACLIAAFVAVLLPRELVARWVGAESGFLGLIIGAFAGVILPGGPLTIFPVAGAFLAVGADMGATVAFVTSWMLLGYTRALVWELPFFGVDFVLWRMLVALPFPILAGLLARALMAILSRRAGDPA
jgi:uncharacterized membrane protein YraQ (UPF0718 family)